MSDNMKVCTKVTQVLKKTMKGLLEKDIVIWAMMVAGIVLGRKAQLSSIAAEIPTEAKDKSTFRRLQRFVSNDRVDAQSYFMPFARQLLEKLAGEPLILALDGSQVGRGCMTLMVGVVYCNRLLPLTWIVYTGKKGHASAESHIQVLEQLLPLVPQNAKVVLLGDGEFDNVEMMDWLNTHTNWDFVVRTPKSSKIVKEEVWVRIQTLAKKGYIVWVKDTVFTNQSYGPVTAIAWWEQEYEEPLYLITSLQDAEEACDLYEKRTLIETLFSDQKSRGFGMDKSHLSDPEKVNRLLMAACLAYIWMVWLGVEVLVRRYAHFIEPNHRRDKSVFRLGLDWLKYSLKHGLQLMISFMISHHPSLLSGVM